MDLIIFLFIVLQYHIALKLTFSAVRSVKNVKFMVSPMSL